MKDNKQIIKELRESLELTQLDVATHLGISKQVISAYEKGKSSIPYKNLKLICELFNTDFETILKKVKESGDLVSQSKATSDTWAERLVKEMQERIEMLEKDKQFLQNIVSTLTEKVNVGKLKANYVLPHSMPIYKAA